MWISEAAAARLRDSLAAPDLSGTRYRIVEEIGRGGMGAVYRAEDTCLNREVALKVLHAEYAETEGALERFRREVKLARRVTHPNVARVYDFGSAGKQRFLTMELVVGASLAERLRAGPLSLADCARVVVPLAGTLAYAHAHHCVHRDLKPSNVLLDDQGAVTSPSIWRSRPRSPVPSMTIIP